MHVIVVIKHHRRACDRLFYKSFPKRGKLLVKSAEIANDHDGVFELGHDALGKKLGKLVYGGVAVLVFSCQQKILRCIEIEDSIKGRTVCAVSDLMLTAPHYQVVLAVIIRYITSRVILCHPAGLNVGFIKRVKELIETAECKCRVRGDICAVYKSQYPEKLECRIKAVGCIDRCAQIFCNCRKPFAFGAVGIAQYISLNCLVGFKHRGEEHALFFAFCILCGAADLCLESRQALLQYHFPRYSGMTR